MYNLNITILLTIFNIAYIAFLFSIQNISFKFFSNEINFTDLIKKILEICKIRTILGFLYRNPLGSRNIGLIYCIEKGKRSSLHPYIFVNRERSL